MKTVFIAGATGYLGRYLCAAYVSRGWRVQALVRDVSKAQNLKATQLIAAEATQPSALAGTMKDADLVVSALGMTRQLDGLGYWDVDYLANLNLLTEAEREGVKRFSYVHVLNADLMPNVELVEAKAAFVHALQTSSLASTVIAPSGYFSDMTDFLKMASGGHVWLFGDGMRRINPIHGADLAAATFDAIAQDRAWIDVGGPDIFTHNELAQLAFETLGRPSRVTHLPDWVRRTTLKALPYLTPRTIQGPAQFFLTAFGVDMVGDVLGTCTLTDHFAGLSRAQDTTH